MAAALPSSTNKELDDDSLANIHASNESSAAASTDVVVGGIAGDSESASGATDAATSSSADTEGQPLSFANASKSCAESLGIMLTCLLTISSPVIKETTTKIMRVCYNLCTAISPYLYTEIYRPSICRGGCLPLLRRCLSNPSQANDAEKILFVLCVRQEGPRVGIADDRVLGEESSSEEGSGEEESGKWISAKKLINSYKKSIGSDMPSPLENRSDMEAEGEEEMEVVEGDEEEVGGENGGENGEGGEGGGDVDGSSAPDYHLSTRLLRFISVLTTSSVNAIEIGKR